MNNSIRQFLLGMATIFDFGGALRDPRVDEILNRSDFDALRSDWETVGRDIQHVLDKIKEGHVSNGHQK